MSRVIVLDTGPLGELVHRKERPAIRKWLREQLIAGTQVRVPDICDYELRRELILNNFTESIQMLDELREALGTIPLTPEILLEASELWASIRKQGLPTAPKEALDGDVILAAQALSLRSKFDEAIIATTNVGHLTRMVTAKVWSDII